MGFVAVEDLGDLAQAHALELIDQRREPAASLGLSVGGILMNAEVGVEKGADQPGPDGAVVVGGIALHAVADVVGVVIGVGPGKRAQAHGGE